MARTIPGTNYIDALDLGTLAWTETMVERYLDIEPFHLNRSGVVHGAIIMSLIDSASGRCGQFPPPGQPKGSSMTVSLTCNFIGQAKGGRLIATAHRVSTGKSLYFTSVEVRNEAGEIVASANGVHRYRSGHGPSAKKDAAAHA